MTRIILILCLILISSPNFSQVNASKDYHLYHQKIVAAESLIAAEEYQSALLIYEGLFQEYEFCYVRDYKIATQLALHLREEEKAQALLLEGIKAGWSIKSIQKNDFLNPLREKENWTSIKTQYANYREAYESGLNQQLKKE